jgi:hypothetical protein
MLRYSKFRTKNQRNFQSQPDINRKTRKYQEITQTLANFGWKSSPEMTRILDRKRISGETEMTGTASGNPHGPIGEHQAFGGGVRVVKARD